MLILCHHMAIFRSINMYYSLMKQIPYTLLYSAHGYAINSNSFWGYVIFDSFNNASREKYDILDQIYINQISADFYLDDLKFS